jgi:probable HAF family extracellular repeat protein
MKAKANFFRTLVVLWVVVVTVPVALFGVGIRSAETQTIPSYYSAQYLGCLCEDAMGYYTYSLSHGINDFGHVVGVTGVNNEMGGYARAFLYKDGVMQDLGVVGEAFDDGATAINDRGRVVGSFSTGNWMPDQGEYGEYQHHAFLYDSTNGMKDLGTLGGTNSSALDINDSGQVVGSSYNSSGQTHAFLYQNGAMTDLGTLGGTNSSAYAINDSGQVVGQASTSSGEQHAFIYDASAATPKMEDLNTLIPADSGWTIRDARAINSNSQIAAFGYKDGVEGGALLLTPTTSDSSPPADDTQAPSPPTITSPQNNSYDKDGSFSVSGSAEASSTVELFEGTTSMGTAKADSYSGAWSIALSGVSEGSHTYTAKATDAAGNTSSASNSVTVTVDKTAPTGSVSINDGASGSRSRSVTLTLSATDPSPGSGVSQMRISNTESGLASVSWEAYSTTKLWTLTSGKGTKTVYVQYRDRAGNESAVATDTISYDR